MKILVAILIMTIAYFIGNISPATILARSAGLDIKKEGSGNAGATNVLRVMGIKAAVITLIVDVMKGFLATLFGFFIAYFIADKLFDPIATPADLYGETVSAWCALAVFLGHIWPLIYNFKGGKGVATALGALIATDYKLALIILGVFIVMVAITRMVSLGSMVAALSFLIIYAGSTIDENSISLAIPIIIPFAIMVVLLMFKHRENIGRILRGEENKLSFRKKDK